MAENWQETAQMYEQLFQKPKMTEKLLSKPPFRYLHDIFTATLSKTGYGNGLFQDSELNSKSFEDKESKLGFLVKLITLTEMVIGEKIDIKPSHVLAGQQAEKTNIFLQCMFKAAMAGIDTSPYVQQILGVGGDGDDGGQDGGDDGAAAAEAQAQAEAQAAAEAQAQQQAAAEHQRKQEEKARRKAEAQKRKEAEMEQQRLEAEAYQRQQEELMIQQQQMEEQQMMQQQMQEQQMQMQRNQVIREGDDREDEDPNIHLIQQPDDVDPSTFDGRGGALVEEAKRLMQDEDEAPKEAENAGPKIKMNRIGKKKKGGAAAAKNDSRKDDKGAAASGGVNWKAAGDKMSNAGFTEKDIEFMKKAIQVLCQSTNPLGKSIDFVTDDIDSMNKEFEHWRKESSSCQQQLEEQQKITEEVIQPLQDQLAELEEKIKEQQSKVNTIKSSIMRNDITVQNLLYSVIASR